MKSLASSSSPPSPHWVCFSSESSSYFADSIVAALSRPSHDDDGGGLVGSPVQRGNICRKVFAGGENYYRIDMEERYELNGKDVIYVASTGQERENGDSDLLELIRLGCAFAAYGARRRVFVIPFLGYSTMERQVLPGEVITAKVNARLLSSIPETKLGNLFLMLDLHVQGILQYFEGPSLRQELYAEKLLTAAIREHLIDSPPASPVLFASADLGRPLWVQSFARIFHTDMAFVNKQRTPDGTFVKYIIGEVKDHHVIIYDDMTRTGGTLINAAEAYLSKGAAKVSAVLSHLALASEEVIKKLEDSPISKVIATNSHPMSQNPLVKASDKFIILDCAVLFADAIRCLDRE